MFSKALIFGIVKSRDCVVKHILKRLRNKFADYKINVDKNLEFVLGRGDDWKKEKMLVTSVF